jgi:hypothetical protein
VGAGEGEALAVRVHLDRVPVGELAGEDLLGERVLDLALDQTLERAGAVDRVEAVAGQAPPGRKLVGSTPRAAGWKWLSWPRALQPRSDVFLIDDPIQIRVAHGEISAASVLELVHGDRRRVLEPSGCLR